MAERIAAQERFERYRQAVTVSEELTGLHASHPSENPLPVLDQIVIRLRSLDAKIRELRAALSGEIAVNFDVPPPPTWRPLSRLVSRPRRRSVCSSAAASFGARALGVVDLGMAPLLLAWRRCRDRLHPRVRRALAAPERPDAGPAS